MRPQSRLKVEHARPGDGVDVPEPIPLTLAEDRANLEAGVPTLNRQSAAVVKAKHGRKDALRAVMGECIDAVHEAAFAEWEAQRVLTPEHSRVGEYL